MNDTIRTRFLELKITGQRFSMFPNITYNRDYQLICYFEQLIKNKNVVDFEDIGFCLQNISDNYALIKDGHSLFDNHTIFYNHLQKNNPQYLYWLVNDATQKLTLEKDGYSRFWWKLYREAMDRNPDDMHYFAQFHTHRAALYKNSIVPYAEENYLLARSNYEKFLKRAKQTTEFPFYQTMFLSQMAQFGADVLKTLLALYNDLLDGLSYPYKEREFLIGEWKSFITPFDKHKQSVVSITAIINALIFCNKLKEAKEIYTDALTRGLPINHYVESRLFKR